MSTWLRRSRFAREQKSHLKLTVVDFLLRQAFQMRIFWLFHISFSVFRVHGQVYDLKEFDPKPSIHQCLGSKLIGFSVVLLAVPTNQ